MVASSTGIHCPALDFIPRESSRDNNLIVKHILFLKKQSLCNVVATRAINHSDNGLTLRISEDVLPCPEPLHNCHGNTLVDIIHNIPRVPDTEIEVVPLPATQQSGRRDSKKLKAVSRVSEAGPSGSLPPHITYLLEIGFDLEQIKAMARNDPYFAYYNLEGKVRSFVEFLLDLGVSKLDLPSIVVRNPRLCGLSLSKNIIPKMKSLETLSVDKTKWAKLISRYPPFLSVSRQKVEATVEFLYEMGLSKESIGKLLNRHPMIICLSIEDQLRPKAEYFQSLGVDVSVLLDGCPQIMGHSMEAKLKPVTEFFLENGFTIEEIGNMLTRFSRLYALSLKGNLKLKWEFFLTTDYSRSDLLKHPQYFGYSLEERIKPRYIMMKESGVNLSLGRLLIRNNDELEVLLKRMTKKLQLEES